MWAYRSRYGGRYRSYKKQFASRETYSLTVLLQHQRERFAQLITHSQEQSPFYQSRYQSIETPENIDHIDKLPILTKEDLKEHLSDIHTINRSDAVTSQTGGTTGTPIEVYFSKENVQERFAMLDNFREKAGYKLGKRTAWFSGKHIVFEKDLKKQRFWKTDNFYNVRYYSTFHIQQKNIPSYLGNLIGYKPEYLIGFTSSIVELATYGLNNDITFPEGLVKAVFPTAETLDEDARKNIETFFQCPVYNQYAASEGAPFIFECKEGNLHLELQSGVFEVLDDNDKPADTGRLVITSFTTYGTPLIRYDIGDRVTLDIHGTCSCINKNPLVKTILGRDKDFVLSEETGVIYVANIANAVKGVSGIIRFQITQKSINSITVLIQHNSDFTQNEKTLFLNNLKLRLGNQMTVKLESAQEILREKSGKYRLIKNYLSKKDYPEL